MTKAKMPLHALCAQGKVQAMNLDFLEADGILDFCGIKFSLNLCIIPIQNQICVQRKLCFCDL